MEHDKIAGAEYALKQEIAKAKQAYAENCATREMTVAEHLDRQIDAAQRHLDGLRDLKASLPGSYLASGASRIASLMARLTVG